MFRGILESMNIAALCKSWHSLLVNVKRNQMSMASLYILGVYAPDALFLNGAWAVLRFAYHHIGVSLLLMT